MGDDGTPVRWERFTTEALEWIMREAEGDSLMELGAEIRAELERRELETTIHTESYGVGA